jgi:DNA adenine methylase
MPKNGPIKWHGGKSYQAEWIISNMPPRAKNPNAPAADDPGWLHYVEPFFGGGTVLLANNPEGISEVANDLNGDLIQFWQVLANDLYFEKFQRAMAAAPFGKPVYEQAVKSSETLATMVDTRIPGGLDRIGRAVRFFIRCRQSMAGRMKGFTPLTRQRTRSGMNAEVSAWLNAIEGLPDVHARLRRVVILNDDAVKVIKQQDGPRTLFYLDPPYLHETRETTGEYDCEMTDAEHAKLLNALSEVTGRFLLSGYPSKLYDQAEKDFGWRHVDLEIDNKSSSAKQKEKKIERLWMNY